MRLRIWTADEPARKLPAGRAQRVNPSLTAIFKEELVLTYGLFFCVYIRASNKITVVNTNRSLLNRTHRQA